MPTRSPAITIISLVLPRSARLIAEAARGTEKVKWLCSILSSPSRLSNMYVRRSGEGGAAGNCRIITKPLKPSCIYRVLELTSVYSFIAPAPCTLTGLDLHLFPPQRLYFWSIIQTHGWWCVEETGGVGADDSACSCWHVDRGQKGKSDVCAQSNQVKWSWRLLSGRLPIFSIYIIVNIVLGKTG